MEVSEQLLSFAITDVSHAGEARRSAVTLASKLGFSEADRGKIAILVTELAKNLALHASNGELHVRTVDEQGVSGLEILSLDKGPGMADFGQCLRDGYSTAGTTGIGLGAIVRLSSTFDVYSQPGVGTAMLSQIWNGPPVDRPSQVGWQPGVAAQPKPGEQVSGDAFAIEQGADRSLAVVADGLGHGLLAHEAAAEAVRVFREFAHESPQAIVERMHDALKPTRGAAAAVVACDWCAREVKFCGIGNISAVISTGQQIRNLSSHNGTLGHSVRRFQEFTYPWPAGGTLMVHTDGLTTQWRLDQYPGLSARHPAIVAGVLYRDHRRQRDDVTVLVARERQRETTEQGEGR